MSSKQLSTELADLAKAANEAATNAESCVFDAVRFARECGRRLTEAKSKVPHGQWGDWLRSNFDRNQRTANRYIRLANSTRMSNLESATSINEALSAIQSEMESPSDPVDDDQITEPNSKRMSNLDPSHDEPEPDVTPEVEDSTTEPADEIMSEVEMALDNASVGREIQSAIRRAVKLVNGLPEAPGTELLVSKKRSIIRDLANAKAAVSSAIPKAICPRCGGDGCAQCGNHGWVNSVLAKELGA